MTLWNQSALLGFYTLSPTHYGTGQTTGAVDLPIARDAVTKFPILPATGIKGVLRDYANLSDEKKVALFGSDIERARESEAVSGEETNGAAPGGRPARKKPEMTAGLLSFTEARLLAWPARSLNRPFLHVTCPLILHTLARDLQATMGETRLVRFGLPERGLDRVLVADRELAEKTLVLEGLIFKPIEVSHSPVAEGLAEALGVLLPDKEPTPKTQLKADLVVIPDKDFDVLMRAAVLVQARIKLTGGKTTDKWPNPETGKEESGNLWYEEYVPSECLFVSFVGQRRSGGNGTKAQLTDLATVADSFSVIQIGGNETVGHGLCLCTMRNGGRHE